MHIRIVNALNWNRAKLASGYELTLYRSVLLCVQYSEVVGAGTFPTIDSLPRLKQS